MDEFILLKVEICNFTKIAAPLLVFLNDSA